MPEIPTELVLSTSAFNTAADCLKKYEYRHVEKLIPRPKDARPVMRRGTWIHRSLQLVDLGLPWESELARMAEWALSHEVDEAVVQTTYSECDAMVRDYLAFWMNREAKEGGPYETVATELPLRYMPVPGKGISATVDRIVKDPKGRLWLWERKTTAEIPDSDWRNVDPQTLIQYAAARMGEDPMKIVGIIFDYVCTDPGPAVQVYKANKLGRGGRIYEGAVNKAVTSRAFDAAVPEIYKEWQDSAQTPGTAMEYVASMRTRMVNEAAWFQRYPVLRPDESVMETLKDVAVTMGNVQRAQASGHYTRSYNALTCRLFCPYGKLCMREYALGRPSAALREELFVIETPELRAEGRSEDAPIAGRK